MFKNLTDRLALTFKKLKGHGKLTETNISNALKEVRLTFLEADVNYKVVKKLIFEIKEKAIGQEVMESLTPAQQVIKIVNSEMTKLMGTKATPLKLKGQNPLIYLLLGLQGSGKTTTSAKLAKKFKDLNRSPILIPADLQRPAAVDQLKRLGSQINIPVWDSDLKSDPISVCSDAISNTTRNNYDTIIVDTAGRLHIDEKLMKELKKLKNKLNPIETLLIADAMTGQDAVNTTSKFHKELGLSGIILTKVDGDARGGAALSIKAVTDVPIKLMGIGEKISDLEIFHPDRLANRILGMGDILSLIEKAESTYTKENAQTITKKIFQEQFNLEDFRKQIRQLNKVGSLESIISLIPGIGTKLKGLKKITPNEKDLKKTEAIISSMTIKERYNYKIINASRKKRIALGSGTNVSDVNKLLKNFIQSQKMIKNISRVGMKKGLGRFLPM